MRQVASASRRSLLVALATQCACPAFAASEPDNQLLLLGGLFDKLAAQLARAIDCRLEISDALLDRLNSVESEILTTSATTINGLRVKARAACWALLGDIVPSRGATTDQRMALSMIRDLIHLYDPEREQPGALAKLLESATGAAEGAAPSDQVAE